MALLLGAVACGPDQGDESKVAGIGEPAASTPSNSSADPSPGSTVAGSESLQARIFADRQRIEGSFRSVEFSAEIQEGVGALATFATRGDSITATITGPREGAIEWKGTTVDGLGPPSPDEFEALVDFARTFPIETLALIPLDLACEPGAEKLNPALGAVLLMPFQLQLMYRAAPGRREAVARNLAKQSRCSYFPSVTRPFDPDRTPSGSIVMLGFEQPLPMTFGYFPFAEER